MERKLKNYNKCNGVGLVPSKRKWRHQNRVKYLVDKFELMELMNQQSVPPEVREAFVNSVGVGSCNRKDCLRISGYIENEYMTILADSGAKVNCIDKGIVQKLNVLHKIRKTGTQLVAANKSSLSVAGIVSLDVRFESKEENREVMNVEHQNTEQVAQVRQLSGEQINSVEVTENGYTIEFIVVENLSVPVLIGWPTQEEMHVLIDSREKTFTVRKGKEVSMKYQQINEDKNTVYSTEEVLIEPNQTKKIQSTWEHTAADSLLVSNLDTPGIVVEEGRIGSDCNFVLVSNYTKETIKIEAGVPIALIEELAEFQEVNASTK
jgi:hypothetical protein